MSQTSNGPSGPGGDAPDYEKQKVQQFAEHAGAQVEHMRQAMDDANERTRAFVRDRPGAALLGAFAIGWMVGKLASKISK